MRATEPRKPKSSTRPCRRDERDPSLSWHRDRHVWREKSANCQNNPVRRSPSRFFRRLRPTRPQPPEKHSRKQGGLGSDLTRAGSGALRFRFEKSQCAYLLRLGFFSPANGRRHPRDHDDLLTVCNRRPRISLTFGRQCELGDTATKNLATRPALTARRPARPPRLRLIILPAGPPGRPNVTSPRWRGDGACCGRWRNGRADALRPAG